MSENIVKVSGCGAPIDAEHIRINAAIIALQNENARIRNIACIAIILSVVALGTAIYAYTKLTTMFYFANFIWGK